MQCCYLIADYASVDVVGLAVVAGIHQVVHVSPPIAVRQLEAVHGVVVGLHTILHAALHPVARLGHDEIPLLESFQGEEAFAHIGVVLGGADHGGPAFERV
jgi:hypothetical protein